MFNLVNDLVVAKERPEGQDIASEVALSFLVRYVDSQLKNEEELFDQTDSPNKDAHKKLDAGLGETATVLRNRFSSGKKKVIDDLIQVNHDRGEQHILIVDNEFVKYCKEKGVGTKSMFDFD